MVEELVQSGIPEELIVLIMSMLPIVELRGALPIAINLFEMSWYRALCLAVIGNLLPIPFLLLFLNSLMPQIVKPYSVEVNEPVYQCFS